MLGFLEPEFHNRAHTPPPACSSPSILSQEARVEGGTLPLVWEHRNPTDLKECAVLLGEMKQQTGELAVSRQ